MIETDKNARNVLDRLKELKKKINYLYCFNEVEDINDILSEYKELLQFVLDNGDDGIDRITNTKNSNKVDNYNTIIERIDSYEERVDKLLEELKNNYIHNNFRTIDNITKQNVVNTNNMWDKLRCVVENNNKFHTSIVEEEMFKNKIAMVAMNIIEQELIRDITIDISKLKQEPYELDIDNIKVAINNKVQLLFESISMKNNYSEIEEDKKIYLENILLNLDKYDSINELIKDYLRVYLMFVDKKIDRETVIDKVKKNYYDFSNMDDVLKKIRDIYGSLRFDTVDDSNPDTLIIEGVKTREVPCRYKNIVVTFIELNNSNYEFDDEDNKIIGVISNAEIINNYFDECYNLEYLITLDNTVEIESKAFSGNYGSYRKLEYVKLGANVYEVGNSAFKDCGRLSEIDFNDKLSYIAPYAFSNTRLKGDIYLPVGLRKFSISAFYTTKVNKVYLGHDTYIDNDIDSRFVKYGMKFYDKDNELTISKVLK